MRQQNIVVMERDGLEARVIVLSLEILVDDPGFDLVSQVKKAVAHYLKTDEGRKVYVGNCGGFNWGDLDAYVPDHICALYGFRKMTTIDHFRDFDEQLVDEDWDED